MQCTRAILYKNGDGDYDDWGHSNKHVNHYDLGTRMMGQLSVWLLAGLRTFACSGSILAMSPSGTLIQSST